MSREMCFKITITMDSNTITMEEVQEAREGVNVTIFNLPVNCLFHTENRARGLARARDPEPGKDRDQELFRMPGSCPRKSSTDVLAYSDTDYSSTV